MDTPSRRTILHTCKNMFLVLEKMGTHNNIKTKYENFLKDFLEFPHEHINSKHIFRDNAEKLGHFCIDVMKDILTKVIKESYPEEESQPLVETLNKAVVDYNVAYNALVNSREENVSRKTGLSSYNKSSDDIDNRSDFSQFSYDEDDEQHDEDRHRSMAHPFPQEEEEKNNY